MLLEATVNWTLPKQEWLRSSSLGGSEFAYNSVLNTRRPTYPLEQGTRASETPGLHPCHPLSPLVPPNMVLL